jgi:hypothetical protein
MRIGPLMLALCLVTTPAAADESGRTLDAFRTFVEVYERIRQQYVEVACSANSILTQGI